MLVNVHEAKTRLSKLIAAAEAGDEVVIARQGKPVVKLVPVHLAGFRFDTLAHLVGTVPNFDEVTDEEELGLWEGGSGSNQRRCSATP